MPVIALPQRPSRHSLRARLALAPLTLLLAGGCAVAQSIDTGRDVAATCSSCHGSDSAHPGAIASLAGRPKEELLARMRDFKSGARGGTVMPQLAKGYTDEQIDVVCAWFAAQRTAP